MSQTDTTTTAEHCIAAIGLKPYRYERSCYDLMRLNQVAVVANVLLYCTSKWMAVLGMFIAPTPLTTIGSGCPEIM